MLDDCLFTPNLQCGIIAHTKQDAAEIFATKIETPYLALPEELRRINPAVELDRSHIKFQNGSSIRVAVSFRSATTHRLLVSEYGKICSKFPARADEIKTGTLPSVHPQLGGRITIESTAEGPAGDFYTLCKLAEVETAAAKRDGKVLGPLQYKFHFYAWWQDPKNTIDPDGITIPADLEVYFRDLEGKHGIITTAGQRAWYSVKRNGPGGLGKKMQQEHPSTPEEAFEQSVEGAVYGDELDQARKDGRIRILNPRPGVKVYTAFDLGYGDATTIWFWQPIYDQIHVIDYYEMTGRGAAYHAAQVKAKEYNYDLERPWCFMPHDVRQHDKGSGVMLKDTYEGCGLKVQVVERPNIKADGIQAVRDLFPRLHFDIKRCDTGLKHLAFYRFDWNEDLNCFGKEPIHDASSHAADSLQTLALGILLHPVGGQYIGGSKTAVRWYQPQVEEAPKRDIFRRDRFYSRN